MRPALAILAVVLAASSAFGQEAVNQAAAAHAAGNAARQAASANRREASIDKRQRNMWMKEHESTIAKLTEPELEFWKKQSGPFGPYYRFDMRQNGAIRAVIKYSPKLGYVVDDKYQDNGLGWTTLDTAMSKRFNLDELYALPDVPGWAKTHLLNSDQQIADIKRRAMEQAKPKAIDKIADSVAVDIVDQLGPKVQEDIGKDLGIKAKVKKKPLQFKRTADDKDKTTYVDSTRKFTIYRHKDGSGFEVERRKKDGTSDGGFSEVFVTLEDAVRFATEQNK